MRDLGEEQSGGIHKGKRERRIGPSEERVMEQGEMKALLPYSHPLGCMGGEDSGGNEAWIYILYSIYIIRALCLDPSYFTKKPTANQILCPRIDIMKTAILKRFDGSRVRKQSPAIIYGREEKMPTALKGGQTQAMMKASKRYLWVFASVAFIVTS